MRTRAFARRLGVCIRAVAVAAFCGVAAAASAQTTVTLPAVTHGTIRGGTYADATQGDLLATRASDSGSYERRALLKFDTHTRIPEGTHVTSAVLAVTVARGNADPARRVAAYQVTQSFEDNEFTWNRRRPAITWITPGGDLGSELAVETVGNTAGLRVKWDVTALVAKAVSGALGTSRYTRVALVDVDAAAGDSYRQYATPTDPNAAAHPTLTVTYATNATTAASGSIGTATASGTTLRVLQWNTHHGGIGTDGKWNPDRLMSWVAKINPDVVSMNEVEFFGYGNTDDPSLFQSLLERKTGRKWYKVFAQASGNWKAHGNGNLILSKYPFASTVKLALPHSRAVVEAEIIVHGRIVHFASTHLDANSRGYRLAEIGVLKHWYGGFSAQRIVAGDFNAWPGTPESADMKAGYHDSWAVSAGAGTSVAFPGDSAGNTRHSRIDYIYYASTASDLVLRYSQVFDTRDAHGVMPSDHRPLMSVFTVK